MTRKFPRNSIEDAFEELLNLRKKVDDLTNRKETTLPFRDVNHLPPGIEGQWIIAEGTSEMVTVDMGNALYSDSHSVAAGDSYNFSFVHSGGETSLDISAPDAPTITIEGFYVISAIVGVGAGATLNAGKYFVAALTDIGSTFSVSQTSPIVPSGATVPYMGVTMSLGVVGNIGKEIQVSVSNNDSVSRAFDCALFLVRLSVTVT